VEPAQDRQENQAAFRQLNGFIQATYPPGRFLAISEGAIIADADGFDELNRALEQMGHCSPDVLVVQAGVDNPEDVVIFVGDAPG
jgi:hypothetical protein